VHKYPGQTFLTRVMEGSNFCCSGRVWLGLKNFPKKSQIFQFCPLGKKISSGRVKKYLGQSRVGLLFTAGQKYVRVWSGPISCPNPVETPPPHLA